MASKGSFEEARQRATTGLRRGFLGDIEAAYGTEGLPITTDPFRPGEFTGGAEVGKAALALMGGARARANAAAALKRKQQEDEYNQLQTELLRRKLEVQPAVEVDLGPGYGKVQLSPDQAARHRLGMAMIEARKKAGSSTRSSSGGGGGGRRYPAAASLEGTLKTRREGLMSESRAKAIAAGRKWADMALRPRPGTPWGGAPDRVHAARVLGLDPRLLAHYDTAKDDVRAAIEDRVALAVEGFVKRWEADYDAKLARRFAPSMLEIQRIKSLEAGAEGLDETPGTDVADDGQGIGDAEFEALMREIMSVQED